MRNLYFFLFSGCIASAQNVVIPDTNFKAALLENDPALYHAYDVNGEYFKVDANSDGEIQNSEALEVYGLNVQSLQIADMAGVQSFSNLEMLDCSYNSITSGNFDGMNHLMYLKMNENNLTTLSLTGCTALLSVECDFNQLTAVDLSGLNSLETAVFSNNALTSITVSGLSNLSMLECTSNFLTELDLSNCANMSFLAVAYNNLTTLDLTGCHPEDVYCNGNPITNVNIKNGFDDSNSNLTIFDLPLEYICTDDFETSAIIDTLEIFGITDCSVNSYCSFTPGGIFYTVQGINRYNAANGECTNANPVYPNLKFFIAEDGGTSGTFISGESGSYQFTIPEGSYTITPMLENSSYFSISPPNLAVGFPSQANPIEQDFCIVPNGVHPDLEVTLLPLQASVPGFDAAYKIVYKNKGNQIQSGIITLTFEDNVQSLLSAAPPTVQTGNTLSWNFTNLMPSQSGEINLTLHLNSPSDTPNVNLGEQLDFTANITSGGADETIADNTSSLQQTVVGSFDPNDKTCLEGSTVSTSVIGDYVHYLIRFENTGTFPAANVVVKDVIDTTKFDLTTLVPLSGSDPFVTRITQGNQVEFIFEGINLPFDDANNDGYVAFKIKTKNTLAAGDSFSNNAEIYFDFNLPVVTEPATTLIEMLGTPDFNFSDVFVLYPNPAGNTFAIQTKNGVGIKSVGIYNALGQLLQTFLGNPAAGYDVSNLSPGNYFLKVSTAEGTSTGQLIKD